jgi:aryl-alcohol dehydrogenase-like predicted oxidoreductase
MLRWSATLTDVSITATSGSAAAYAAALPDVAVIETSVSIADQHNIDAVLPVARQHDVGVLAKRPVANAAWKDINQQQGLYKNYAKTYTDRLAQMKLDPASLGVAGPAAAAWPELALRFTLSQPGVHTAIIGTTNPDNARQNIAYAEKGALPQDVVEKIREAFRNADPEGKWTGQT